MENERKIMVIGHKNPDTDSICSAIAYAEIKNRISNSNKYVPARAGEISAETRFVLERFNIPEPEYVGDVAPQVKDMEIQKTPGIHKNMTIKEAWNTMSDNEAATQPIVEGNKIIGIITKGDIARTFMDAQDNTYLSTTAPRFCEIAETLRGEIVVGDPERFFNKGKVLVGAAHVELMQTAIEPHDLIILVDRSENQIAALESGADCLILCLGAKADKKVLEMAKERDAVIIETALDTFSVSREISKTVPVKAFMTKEGIRTFRTDDFAEEVRSEMSSTRHRGFPVVDVKGNYVGTVSRRSLLNIQNKKVILVDHNEKSQAVDNIDEAHVLEVIDHHRLGTLQTLQPITFINQPVGCTATILYQMYVEKGIEISCDIAGLLCAAILSDTLMFRSPTCTTQDKMAAGALALIADIDIESFATEMFEVGSDLRDKSAEEIFYQDYKKFTFNKISFGVGQISSMSTDELEEIKKRLLPLLKQECGKNGVSMVFFLLTSIKDSSSEIIYAGKNAKDMIEAAFENASPTEGGFYLPGVLSRKKQLIPPFMNAVQSL